MDGGCLPFQKDIRWWNCGIGWRKSCIEGRKNKVLYISVFNSTWLIHHDLFTVIYFSSLCIDNSPTSCSVSLNRLFRLQLYAPSKSWLISNTIRPFWRFRKVLVTRFSCSLSRRPRLRTQNWPLSPKVFSRHWRVILFCNRPMYATVTDCAVTSVGNWEKATNTRERIQNATMLYFNQQQLWIFAQRK